MIGEQIRDADPGFRRNIDTTLRDMLGHPPFYGSDVPDLAGRGNNPDPDTLVADVKEREEKNPKKLSVAHVELGVRGGVALVLLGALAREHGALASEAARPYTVLQRMLHDPMGQEILGEAIKALRAGDNSIPARDPQTGKPIGRDAENRVVPMTPANIRELFTGSSSGGGSGSADDADDLITEMKDIARNKLGKLLARLKRVPDVAKQGVAPHKVADLTDLLMEQAGDLDYLGRKGADHLSASEDEASPRLRCRPNGRADGSGHLCGGVAGGGAGNRRGAPAVVPADTRRPDRPANRAQGDLHRVSRPACAIRGFNRARRPG